MASVSAIDKAHATLSTTVADLVTLTGRHKEVIITNHSTTVPVYVNMTTASTAAGVATPTTAVGGAAETFAVAPGQTRRIFRSSRGSYHKFSIVGSANPYSIMGNNVGLWNAVS